MSREDKMKNSIEIEGGSVEEAIRKALDKLKVSRENISIKIVSEEKKGLFGMEGEKPAKIRVTIKKTRKKVDI